MGKAEVPKSVKSYTRLLNAGFIKKADYDNRVKKISSAPSFSAPHAAAPRSASAKQANHTTTTNHPAHNSNNPNNHKNHDTGGKTKTALAAHVLSSGPVSNLSGQYPTNGMPGGSMLR